VRRLRAVVVGIERYAAGPAWAIDGAAVDAVLVTNWLIDNGVDKDDIALLVAPLPHNAAVVAACGVEPRSPTKSVIYDVFTRDLRETPHDRLFLYWGGHGVVDPAGGRRLFCADATTADKRNVDFDGLRGLLASTYFTGFRMQHLFVDACQVFASERRYLNALPVDGWPGAAPRHGVEQHALFAASPGEAAVNLAMPRTGLFTTELMAQLEATDASPFDLDMPSLATTLDSRFTALRQSGQGRQAPAYVWHKAPHVEGLMYATGPRTNGRRMSTAQLKDLVDVILGCDELADTPSRQQLIMLMPADIRSAIDFSGTPRRHVISWIRACERFTTGRSAFVDAIDLYLTNREDVERILLIIDRVWPP
jgi:hypothetical protein